MNYISPHKRCSLYSIISILDFVLLTFFSCTIAYEVVLFSKLATWTVYPLSIITLLTTFILFKKYCPKEALTVSKTSLALLISLAVATACINIFTLKPDGDDFSFLYRAILSAQNLTEPLYIYANALELPKLPAISPVHLATSIETVSTLIATACNIDPLFFTHNILGSLSLFLFPIILFIFFLTLGLREYTALLGTAITIIVYSFTGDFFSDWGNFTLVRSWQGKSIYMILLAPLTTLLALKYLVGPKKYTTKNLIRLHFVVVSGIGLTSSAFFLYPYAVFSTFFIYFIMSHKKKHSIPKLIGLTSTMLFPLCIIGLIKFGYLPPVINTDVWNFGPFLENRYPEKSEAISILLMTMFHTHTTPAFYFCSLALLLGIFKLPKVTKIFLFSSIWILICLVTPPISTIAVKHILPAAYWRLVYTANMLIIISLAMVYCITMQKTKHTFNTILHKSQLLTTIFPKFLFSLGITSLISYCVLKAPAVQPSLFSKPQYYKISQQNQSILKQLIHSIPQNAVGLCYEDLLSHLSLLRPDLRFISTRYYEIIHTFFNIQDHQEAYNRINLICDLLTCGGKGFIQTLLTQQKDIAFIIFPPNCTQEALLKNLNLSEENWSIVTIDTVVVLLRKEHK